MIAPLRGAWSEKHLFRGCRFATPTAILVLPLRGRRPRHYLERFKKRCGLRALTNSSGTPVGAQSLARSHLGPRFAWPLGYVLSRLWRKQRQTFSAAT